MKKTKKPKRNYRKEYETERKNYTRITIKIKKDKAEKLKKKVAENEMFFKSVHDYFKQAIDAFIGE